MFLIIVLQCFQRAKLRSTFYPLKTESIIPKIYKRVFKRRAIQFPAYFTLIEIVISGADPGFV